MKTKTEAETGMKAATVTATTIMTDPGTTQAPILIVDLPTLTDHLHAETTSGRNSYR